MSDLTDFLLARFTEDAKDACAMAGLNPDGTDDWAADTDGYAVSARMTRVARRVLAECEANRQIVEEHKGVDRSTIYVWGEAQIVCRKCVEFHADMDCQHEVFPCLTLRALAFPYADHQDYREEWRP